MFPAQMEAIMAGRLDYAAGLRLQAERIEQRRRGERGDTLLLLEHAPVITLGRNARRENIVASAVELQRRGIPVIECNRGGDVTWHGPGQLVGYPIFDLRGWPRGLAALAHPRRSFPGLGPVDYVRGLELALIAVLAEVGLATQRLPGLTGVWTITRPARKIAAIGVHVSRGITSHGFALNLATDLSGFQAIIPCGLSGHEVTSLERETGAAITLTDAAGLAARHVGLIFEREVEWQSEPAAVTAT